MKIVESLMMSVLFVACIFSASTDLKSGIIENKMLKNCGIISLVCVVVYYGVFESYFFRAYLINFSLMVLISLLMYKFNLWAAGDAKLVILISFVYPARLYGSGLVPLINIVIASFSFAFVYVLIETIYLSVVSKQKPSLNSDLLMGNITKFLFGFVCLYTFDAIIIEILGPIKVDDTLLSFANLFLSIALLKRYIFLSKKTKLLCFSIVTVLAFVSFYKKESPTLNLTTVSILILLLLVQMISEKYNYQEIKISDVKRGMILSATTVFKFIGSRVQGLPRVTTEDMRSRISENEVDAIKRWQKSKKGKDSIVIVKKIPFAIFIFIGALMYFLRGVL